MRAVVLAGGAGTRLRPLTQTIPKPLLPVGPSSVIEIGLRCLQRHGVRKVFIAARYRADFVRAFVGNGASHGLDIEISVEQQPLGTCGPLSLLRDRLDDRFILMNGDVLTTLDFSDVYRQSAAAGVDLTVVTKRISTALPYGKVVTEGDRVLEIHEKPELSVEVLTGVYVMSPAVFELIPHGKPFGIDDLIGAMLQRGRSVHRYLTDAYWRDIGHVDGYQRANLEFQQHFGDLFESDQAA